jgi:hypothetical protein
MRTITFLLDNGLLKFNAAGASACFDVVKDRIETKIEAVTSQWVDDYLGMLEDIAGLWRGKHLTIQEVEESFGHYVSLVGENEAIQEYVAWARNREATMWANDGNVRSRLK